MNKITDMFDPSVKLVPVEHGFLKVVCERELFVDSMNGELYSEMPEFVQYGDFEITYIGGWLYTRTKRIYGVKSHPAFVWRGKYDLYLTLPYDGDPEDETRAKMIDPKAHHDVCLLNGDESGVYWQIRVLEDDSIVVMDDNGEYFHVRRDAKTGKAVKSSIGYIGDEAGRVLMTDIVNQIDTKIVSTVNLTVRQGKVITKRLKTSLTERAYELGFNDDVCNFEDKGFYLDIFVKNDAFWFDLLYSMGKANVLHSACILANDDEDWYFLNLKLDDGSIIILNQEKKYYHVADGKKKRYIGCEGNEEETEKLMETVKTIRDRARRKMERIKEEKHKRRLERLLNVVPFESNGKWGLRLEEKTIVPPIYHNIKEPVDKYCAVETSTRQWGIIRVDGKVIVDTCYKDIDIKKNGTARLTISSGKTVKMKLG